MEFHRNNTLPADDATAVVTGSSLSEAFKRVRQEFGPEAVIAGSRSRSRRKSQGWGTDTVVEVLVETSGTTGRPLRPTCESPSDLTREIRYQVERMERLVQDICVAESPASDGEVWSEKNPLAEHLVNNGASPGAVTKLLTRFASETGHSRQDRTEALVWLTGYLDTGEGSLPEWSGHHAFLSEHSADRLDPVLHLAGTLTEIGRRVLVVSVLPDPHREEPRLKAMAATAGYDAAVVRDIGQLEDMEDHLDGYDHVLLDLPSLADPRMTDEGPIHSWLAANENFHRHLSVPMDRDFQDLDDLREAVRSWNCDWLALTRVDGTRRAAKLLDLVESIPLPISFTFENVLVAGILSRANPEQLLDRILATATPSRFKPGVVAPNS
jgi:hypothetical protein